MLSMFLTHSGVNLISYLRDECIKQIEALGGRWKLNIEEPSIIKYDNWNENGNPLYSLYFRIQYLIEFDNGYMLSAIKISDSNWTMDDNWEVAVKTYICGDYIFDYIDGITDEDGLVYLRSDEELVDLCEKIAKLND